jgi:hypothetical protein
VKIAHVFCHGATNLGDIYLRRGTREAFRTIVPDASFTDVETRRLFTDADIEALNDHDLVLIGGGGLLLRDTFPNDRSDWQLGMDVEQLGRIRVPMVVHAIGYNRFRGQEDFRQPLFSDHVTTLLERSVSFTVRNHGSARALRGYVPEGARERIRVCPCPSLFWPSPVVDRELGTRRVGLLLAGDRLERRHPDLPAFTARLRRLVEGLTRHAEVTTVVHQPQDRWYYDALAGMGLREIDLVGASPDAARAAYTALDTVIGDRGHAQMIPFALGCRIVSVVSHDKLAWFLEDAGLEDHGVEESDPDLSEKILAKSFPEGDDGYRGRRLQALADLSRLSWDSLCRIRERV